MPSFRGIAMVSLAVGLAVVAATLELDPFVSFAADDEASRQQAPSALPKDWVAAGPGRIEPSSGRIRISSPTPGRIDVILVRDRDRVAKGDLLAQIEDSEQQARVTAAKAEVAFREAERETAVASGAPSPRRTAEDDLASSEQKLWSAQRNFDQLEIAHAPFAQRDAARAALHTEENNHADKARALEALVAATDAGRPLRTESALAVARAELGIAMAALEKTRIRAPTEGTILSAPKLAGDMAAAASDDVLFEMGNIDRLHCKVEIEEGDIANVSIGQRVVVRSDAFPNQEFAGAVTRIGASVRPRQLAAGGAAPALKDNALEIDVELEAATPLIPGMHVNAFFLATDLADGQGGQNDSRQ